MNQLTSRIKNIFSGYDWILVFTCLGLSSIGLISLFSTTQPIFLNFYKQMIWIGLGLLVMALFSSFDYRLFKVHFAPVLFLYFVGLASIISLYFVGSTVRGARSWIELGPLNIEPVEALKIVLILILAKYFSMRHVEMYRIRHVVVSGLYVLIPAALVLVHPDMGSFIILVALWGGILMVSGIKVKHLALLGLVAIVLMVFAWSSFLLPHQKARIVSFLNPNHDPYGSGYNSTQSIIAVASGGIWGKGLAQGTQSQLGYLPEAHTDFIYAAIVEEFGIFMALILLACYAIFFWRMLVISHRAADNFAKFFIVGISVIVAAQLVLNVGMNIGIMPITGLTLPFVSYGGSSLITLFMAMGIVQSINKRALQREPEQVFDLE